MLLFTGSAVQGWVFLQNPRRSLNPRNSDDDPKSGFACSGSTLQNHSLRKMCWDKMICYKGISIMTWRQHEIWIDVHIGTRTAIVHLEYEYLMLMFAFDCPWECKDFLFSSFHHPFCVFAQPHHLLFMVLPHAMKSDFDLTELDQQRNNKVRQEVSRSK